MEPISSIFWQSPAGFIKISGTGSCIHAVDFCETYAADAEEPPELLLRCRTQLQEYFDHHRTTFDLPCLLKGSPFETEVWQALQQIPFGQTVSYQELANMSGNPRAMRAVGNACHKNQLAILVPCHRVTGKTDLTGYRFGRFRKEFLIRHEARRPVQYILF